MGWHNSLVSSGLTNKDSETTWNTTVSVPHTTYALCCGETHSNTNKDQCYKCRQYLKWENRVTSVAHARMNAYIKKHELLREAHVQKERQSRIG